MTGGKSVSLLSYFNQEVFLPVDYVFSGCYDFCALSVKWGSQYLLFGGGERVGECKG